MSDAKVTESDRRAAAVYLFGKAHGQSPWLAWWCAHGTFSSMCEGDADRRKQLGALAAAFAAHREQSARAFTSPEALEAAMADGPNCHDSYTTDECREYMLNALKAAAAVAMGKGEP